MPLNGNFMSVPTVIIFEQHWDKIPKQTVQELLPSLSQLGYRTLSFEAPADCSSEKIIRNHATQLEEDDKILGDAEALLRQRNIKVQNISDVSFKQLTELMHLYVSSQRYAEVAEKIKQIPASKILKEIFRDMQNHSITVKGVDVDRDTFSDVTTGSFRQRVQKIDTHEPIRISSFFSNLMKIKEETEEGVIFVCGAKHADGLLEEFKKRKMEDELLYYFLHSGKRYDDSFDGIALLQKEVCSLNTHTYKLTEKEVKPFSEKIISDIRSKTKYTKELPEGNSHSQFLTAHFKAPFKAFLRPGYYVDALLTDREEMIESIEQKLKKTGITSQRLKPNQLIVPAVNTKEVAGRIRRLSTN